MLYAHSFFFYIVVLFFLLKVMSTPSFAEQTTLRSFGSTGSWVNGTYEECFDLLMCSPISNLTYKTHSGPFYNYNQSCALVSPPRFHHIFIWGDSFMRHLSQAFMMTLTNNLKFIPKTMSQRYGVLPDECEDGNVQFDEKSCSGLVAHHTALSAHVCNNNSDITLDYIYVPFVKSDLKMFARMRKPCCCGALEVTPSSPMVPLITRRTTQLPTSIYLRNRVFALETILGSARLYGFLLTIDWLNTPVIRNTLTSKRTTSRCVNTLKRETVAMLGTLMSST